MKHLLMATICCSLLASCGGDSSSGSTSRQQTNPTPPPAPTVSELQARLLPPNTVEAPPAAGKMPASLKPPRT